MNIQLQALQIENPSSGTLWRICTRIKGYYRGGTRSRNRSKRRARVTIITNQFVEATV